MLIRRYRHLTPVSINEPVVKLVSLHVVLLKVAESVGNVR